MQKHRVHFYSLEEVTPEQIRELDSKRKRLNFERFSVKQKKLDGVSLCVCGVCVCVFWICFLYITASLLLTSSTAPEAQPSSDDETAAERAADRPAASVAAAARSRSGARATFPLRSGRAILRCGGRRARASLGHPPSIAAAPATAVAAAASGRLCRAAATATAGAREHDRFATLRSACHARSGPRAAAARGCQQRDHALPGLAAHGVPAAADTSHTDAPSADANPAATLAYAAASHAACYTSDAYPASCTRAAKHGGSSSHSSHATKQTARVVESSALYIRSSEFCSLRIAILILSCKNVDKL